MYVKQFIILIAMLFVAGCRSTQSSTPNLNVAARQRLDNIALLRSSPKAFGSDLDALIAARGPVTFRSCDGKYIGTDGDSDLTLYPGGRAHMTEYGFAVSEYRGTFSIDKNGIVKAVFPTFYEAWPDLELHRDRNSLFLIPTSETEFVGGIDGSMVAPRWYFPFRPITLEEESKYPPSPDK